MNANDNHNINQENEAHEIPADPSLSDNDDHEKSRSGNVDLPNESGNVGREHDLNHGDGESEIKEGSGNNDGEENNGNHSSACKSTSQMFNPNIYPNNGPQFPPISDHQHSHFDPSSGNASYEYYGPPSNQPFLYNPHHQPHMSSLSHNHLTPVLPPPPSMLMPPTLTNDPNNNGPTNLDVTRQYYEARMREHAMQYANAAAGAAWAAARIACGGVNGLDASNTVGMSGYMTNNSLPSYYTPASEPPNGMVDHSALNDSNQVMESGPRQKRTLWNPSSSLESKSKGGGSKVPQKAGQKHDSNSSGPKAKAQKVGASKSTAPQQEKKRSKKRESGNDSVSSLGSESRDLSIGRKGGSNSSSKHASKKSNQKRRFNEDARGGNPTSAKNENDNGNLRQKRGLHHGHSSKSSFSSHGSNNATPSAGRNKKKNRSQPQTPSSSSSQKKNESNSSPPSSIFLGGLIGKNGARALHELCSKYRWEMPKYTSIEPQSLENSAGNDGNSNNDISFILTVNVNGVELGRGRGGTKVSAKQDASRKALAALVPGVVFDPNGILLDVGSELLLRGSNDERGTGGSSRNVGSKSLSLDELGPHLASQLAIGGNANPLEGVRSRPLSPDHSADSSISTTLSEEVFSGGPLISGGPLSFKLGLQQASPSGTLSSANAAGGVGRFFSSNIYPCASTTSGISSASDVDDEDENVYYSSRGASVCSTLLHAIWQIDDRIREPPSYTFDLCNSQVNITGHLKSGTPAASGTACSKRKKVESPREITGHRMFQCVASLNVYFPNHLVGDRDLLSLMDYWESPLDYLQSKECSSSSCGNGESSQSRKRKDSFASQSTPSPNRQQLGDAVEEQERSPKLPKKQEKEEFIQHKLESTGTGSTKRESKHKASAKLLATLFPACTSMVEVKAESEAARELYAANKAASQTKRAKFLVSSPERQGLSKRCVYSNTLPSKNDISLHALSLSELQEGTKRIKWSESSNVEPFENEVDATLQSLQELDEDGRLTNVDQDDSVGKIILRRANLDDIDHVHALLNKNETTPMPAKKQRFSTSSESVAAEIDGPTPESDNVDVIAGSEENAIEDNKKELQLGENAIFLVLSRAVALHDPPLGCALLTLDCPSNEGQNVPTVPFIHLVRLGHEQHLPRERFIECLETFAKNMQLRLCTSWLGASELAVTSEDIRSFLSRSPPPYQAEDVVDSVKGNSSHRHLQSVKEEDSEEVDDGSEGGEDSDKKIDVGGSELVKGRPCKPSKRSRVA
mmetsp:Transcript_10676/g.23621  ORF Transcript_10676/g.23621 Transcript_10676/m.23621 type:complete len:1257 (+) Transcript_10676:118-3888(+)|eukprot:CAMPEP_0172323934 /NCGR_PEP_ID=MMETSP1058-20130122/49955_1 /TAXON_ID=83371 /ORGANISM="Detonula confervacea, Strain CCMP 353" /LENGTH=1256 /DNA_ID=CAMNT_0013040063 /DNA_START=115 /DNA_END=3885 /DNA_ORIENTATION=-